MIYFDNAATTLLKPPAVAQAVADAINGFGGVGRGAHEAALSADRAVYAARKQISDLFNGPGSARVAFGYNVTEALNMVVAGLLHEGDHAITTAASHNSVLRPLFRKQDEEGVAVSVLPVASDASIDYNAFEELFRPNTRLVVVTHASNLTGDVYDVARMARIAHDHGALICIDAAQTAGVVPIDMQADGIDIVAFTGHKSLFGPQGTGGLCLAEHVDIPWFKVGGTGVHSYDRHQPLYYPERLEAGTINAHGIAGLSAGLAFIEEVGTEAIHAHELALVQRFEEGIQGISAVRLYGGHGGIDRTGIVSVNVGDVDSSVVSDLLAHEYGICTRPGAHCAPLMHEALSTNDQGQVRFSFGYFNTAEEVDTAIDALAALSQGLSG